MPLEVNEPAPMTDQPEPQQAPAEDLAQADAKAFMAANNIHSDSGIKPSDPADRVAVAVTNAETHRDQALKHKPPVALYVIAAAAVIVLVIVLSLLHQATPKGSSGNNSAGLLTVPTPNNNNTSGLSNQAQQDIKTCSNVVNAALEC
jgi:hypothetical protein